MGLLHSSLLNVMPSVELVALCDKSPLMNRLFRRIFSKSGTIVVNSIEKLSEFELDAVYVTTPISSHSFIIRELYEKKMARNVFTEKTLAANYDQAKELCRISEVAGGTAMVGYMKRFSVVFRKAKELLEYETLGIPRSFKAYAYSSDFLGLTKESKSSASRGGALRDLGCHVIDLALWMLGDLEIREVSSVLKGTEGSETSVSFKAGLPSGLIGQFNVSQCIQGYRMPEFGLTIECSNGVIEVNDDRLILTSNSGSQQKWYRHNLNDNVYFSMGEAEYYRENEHFVNSVIARQKAEPSFETGSKVDRLIDDVKKRVQTAT